jgi:hypothetical protein
MAFVRITGYFGKSAELLRVEFCNIVQYHPSVKYLSHYY